MKHESLWLNVSSEGRGATAVLSLRRCPNCGEVKILSRPCGFDHLAAVMEFNASRAEEPTA